MEPPEVIDAGDLVLKRWQPQWADDVTVAVRESLPELGPFLAWAQDGYAVADSVGFIERSVAGWANRTDFNYAVFTAADELIGGIGLMTRRGPGVLEIGYWLRTSHTGRGHMTAAVDVLSRVALAVPGIKRVQIRFDAANAASAAVAIRAGFVEVERIDREPEAPGETGVEVVRERT